jgi:ABC-type ATPase involved in cell division
MIELVGVTFAHAHGPTVLAGADLAVGPGEVVLLGAPAGAGASTIAALLAGRHEATGRVAIAGRDLARLRASSKAALRQRLGIVPQDLALVDDRTALDNVALALEVAGVGRAARAGRANQALAAVGVAAGIAVRALPMAARQRVAWARAFVRNPDVLIADQPTSHQDADGADLFAELTAELAAAGAACVVLAREPHLVAAAARRGWRALTLHQHRLVDVADVAPDEIDAAEHVVWESSRPRTSPPADDLDIAVDEAAAIPNVVPFPVARSAGNRVG